MRITLTAFTASLLISTSAFAVDKAVPSAIDALPKTGEVTVSGAVDKVIDKDTFILRDASGKTIDVHTASNLNVKQGQQVTVHGQKTDEIAGMGEEIQAATIRPLAGATAAVKNTVDGALGAVGVGGNARAGTETPYAMKNNKADLPDTSYDVDVDHNRDGSVTVSADRQPDLKRNDAGVPINNNPHHTAAHGEVNANAKAPVLGSIDALPEKGSVELKGTVANVSGADHFTLQDANGKTIAVETAAKADVKKGDTVTVRGVMGDRMLGMGRQIEGAKVMVIGAK